MTGERGRDSGFRMTDGGCWCRAQNDREKRDDGFRNDNVHQAELRPIIA
jgi:hypothetical protein